jgi:hypothetical protein
VNFDYVRQSKAVLELERVLRERAEFELSIARACKPDGVTDVYVDVMTPGLSGAAVFLVRRIATNVALIPWVIKVCSEIELINAERDNYERCIQGILPQSPALIDTGANRLLIYSYGGFLSNPYTLRSGYAISKAEALAPLMRRIVTSLESIHRMEPDGMSCVNRMPRAHGIEEEIKRLRLPIPTQVAADLSESWRRVLKASGDFPLLRCTGHGDLNSGNVLFEPGDDASHPVFIDFASMRESKDSVGYPPYFHLPFWDYAKLERDIQTRLFLKEALDKGLENEEIIGAVRAINGDGEVDQGTASLSSVAKLLKTTWALRNAINEKYSPDELRAYRVVVAYAMLTAVFREPPDSDVSQARQLLVAAASSIALLNGALSPLPAPAPPRDTGPLAVALKGEGSSTPAHSRVPWRRASGLRWVASCLGIVLISAVAYQLIGHRLRPKESTPTTQTPDIQHSNLPAQPSVAPVLTSKSSTTGLAQPAWSDIESRVQRVYYSVSRVDKLGDFVCAKDPKYGCYQDVNVIEQGENDTLTVSRVTVFYTHDNGQWKFWKLVRHD